MPTTYSRDGEAKHLRRRKNVHRVFTNTAQVTAKHRQNTNLLHVPTENVSKHQVQMLSATKSRESVEVNRDVSEHCQAVI